MIGIVAVIRNQSVWMEQYWWTQSEQRDSYERFYVQEEIFHPLMESPCSGEIETDLHCLHAVRQDYFSFQNRSWSGFVSGRLNQ